MKKIMLAFVLAIASSVWTMSEAICITQRSSFPGDDSWYGGTLQLVGMPCEEGEVCPPCLTVALMMYGHTYYLAGDERMNSLQAQLDTIEYPAKALINGVYYKQGSFDFIYVEQLFLNPENQYRLPSLCDTWNVLMDNRFTLGSAEGRCWTDRFKLQGDTIINNTKYAQMLYADGLYTYAQLQWNYYGSIRETENAEIYFIPAGQNKEYLLYAFNAKVGDIFKNLYGMIEGNDVWAEVKEVTEKEIVLELKGRYEDVEYTYFENYVWIKGVGANLALFQPLPSGTEGGPIINNLLCAYRNDEQVYTSEMGQKYGCYYDGEKPQDRLPSLCDEWNVLHKPFECIGPNCFPQTIIYRLSADTLIQDKHYVKLMSEEGSSTTYKGALREGTNRDIYYVPENSTNEYLIYAFNAQVGDELENVWLGGEEERGYCINAHNATVIEISNSNPRIFTLEIIPTTSYEDKEIYPYRMNWIEGIGMSDGPVGSYDRNQLCTAAADMGVYSLLCAYMEGEQVYTSEMGQKYGCYYDGGTQQDRLPSLCDEWNVLMDSGFELGPVYGEIWTNGFKVQGDTIINNIIYSRLLFADGHQKKHRESREWVYYGALREAANAEIYFIPAGKNKEYLLYAFNAQVGDRMNNLYIMDDYKEWNVWAIVKEISGNEIILDFYEQLDDREDIVWHNYTWVKGIGAKRSMFQPIPINSGGGVVNFLLCAYNDEKHIYTSEFGEKYGCEYNGEEPMFTSDTRWDYVYTEMYGGPDYKPTYFSIGPIDTLINHIRYQQIRGFLFRSEGAKVWCLLDSMGIPVERLVYDFDLQIGDSIRTIFTNWEALDSYSDPTPQYVKVTKVENIILPDGRSARRLSYDYRPDDIEHIGSVSVDDGILAPLNLDRCQCGKGDHFLCCTRGDILLYEVAEGACDTFFVDNRPYADTIPLFKDGPGSSTVQPVDPNQIVAVLQMDVLSIFEYIGKEIGYKLTVLSSSENASASRRMVKSDTFEQSVSVSLAESGTYMLELTNPDWDYTIVGTFEYNIPHGIEPVETSVPAAQKILRNGQLLIRKGDKIYTLTGVQIQ